MFYKLRRFIGWEKKNTHKQKIGYLSDQYFFILKIVCYGSIGHFYLSGSMSSCFQNLFSRLTNLLIIEWSFICHDEILNVWNTYFSIGSRKQTVCNTSSFSLYHPLAFYHLINWISSNICCLLIYHTQKKVCHCKPINYIWLILHWSFFK